MRRYLIISLIFHVGVALGSTFLSPLGSFSARDKRPNLVINVGLVDLGDKARAKAGAAAAKAIEPVKDVTPKAQPEKIAEPEKKKPAAEKKPEPAKDKKAAEKDAAEKESKKIATKDTTTSPTGTITEGSGEADVWGVETGADVNPYHRRGFAAIRTNWRNPAVGPQPLKCIIRFTVNRDGELDHIELEQKSGSELFDRAAIRAVQVTKSWEKFPHFWTDDEQIIHLEFEYRP